MRDNSINSVTEKETPILNTTQGVSGSTIEFLLGQVEQKSICTKAAEKRKTGQTIRDGFKCMKSLKAAGQMIALTGTFKVGKNTLDEINRRAAEKQTIKDEQDAIKQESRDVNIRLFNDLIENKPEESKWTKKDILLALRTVKQPGDRANPTNREELMSYWKELSYRGSSFKQCQGSEAINQEGIDVVLNMDEVDSRTCIQNYNTDLDVKEGANEKTPMTV
jgi:hypothetical protein